MDNAGHSNKTKSNTRRQNKTNFHQGNLCCARSYTGPTLLKIISKIQNKKEITHI